MSKQQNDHLILVSGMSTTGKSASLMDLRNPEGVVYLNCESNKKLPFKKSKFQEFTITDPYEVVAAFDETESMPEVHTIIIDSLTYLMDMFETLYVTNATDTRKAWGDYGNFFKNLMQNQVAKSTKNVVFLAHTKQVMNETEMVLGVQVAVKGALNNQGVESYFSTVISTKRLSLKALKNYTNDLLVITEDNEIDQFKYVFQTRINKDTVNERMRSPIGMWSRDETYIDNNLQSVIDRLQEFYA